MNAISPSIFSKFIILSNSRIALFGSPLSLRRRTMVRLGTSLHDRLGEILFTAGLDRFLSIDTQREPRTAVSLF